VEADGRIYRRNLPHFLPANTPIFLTWRIAGSLPHTRIATPEKSLKLTDGERFRALDVALDKAVFGPSWLTEPRIAECVAGEIEAGHTVYARCELYEFVIMPNYVHVLLLPREEPRHLMRILERHYRAKGESDSRTVRQSFLAGRIVR
jgi:putative transposase